MKKIFALSAASILMAAPAMAATVNISRGEDFAIRSCPIDGDMSRGVCYNTETEWSIDDLPFSLSGLRARTHEVDCEGRVLRQIGKEFCPVREQLAPAPFL